MFNNPPKILAHISSLKDGNFVTPEYILGEGKERKINLFRRFCPHRMYPLAEPGVNIENIVCKFHGFEWTKDGVPVNNDRKINCGIAQIGRSGLVFKNFVEPDHWWVDTLAEETSLEFSHVCKGESKGSWLWMMEIQADLLHIRPGENVIHPQLASETNLEDISMEQGDGWILQTCSSGWWLFVYPYTFVEWSKGCVSVNYTTPNDPNNEFGFTWITQFYYDPAVSKEQRMQFETLENVFHEDVAAIELQKGAYFPLITAHNHLENHCVHFGKWVNENYSTNRSIT
jgi:phenylpropionate dioxygenase-like ring-hydroxylating dioxygenase large terminal subunit